MGPQGNSEMNGRNQSSDIVIVSGLPRSGTSLMMQMLSAGGIPPLTDGARAADEDNPKGYFELEAVKRTRHDSSWLERAAGKAVKVIHLLILELPPTPQYSVILMRRAMDEVIRSQSKMLERSGKAPAALSGAKLGELFAMQLHQVRAHMSATPAFRFMEIDYRECVESPAHAAARVNQFLGGGLDQHRMAAVVDAALWRNRQAP